VTQLITALVSIHSSMTLYDFLDPPSRTVLFSVDDRSLFPVGCMIGLFTDVF